MGCEFRSMFTTPRMTLSTCLACWKAIWTCWSESERVRGCSRRSPVEYYAKPLAKKLTDRLAGIMPIQKYWPLLAALLSLIRNSPPIPGQTQPAHSVTVIRAGKLFDSESGRLLDHPVVVVKGNRV